MSRPPAGLSWSGWKARRCQGLPRWGEVHAEQIGGCRVRRADDRSAFDSGDKTGIISEFVLPPGSFISKFELNEAQADRVV